MISVYSWVKVKEFYFYLSFKSQISILSDEFDKYGPWIYIEMKLH